MRSTSKFAHPYFADGPSMVIPDTHTVPQNAAIRVLTLPPPVPERTARARWRYDVENAQWVLRVEYTSPTHPYGAAIEIPETNPVLQ